MVIFTIDVGNFLADKLESHAPVAAHLYSPGSFALASQLMHLQTGKVYVFEHRRRIQAAKNEPQSVGVLRLNPCFGSASKESLQTLVLEASNHKPV